MAWPRLPQVVHHALKALCWLATTQGSVRAHELAGFADIPAAHAAKVLYLLT